VTSILSDEARMLRESAVALCAAEFPMERVRRMADDPGGVAAEAYRALAGQGWLGILVPEALGGAGLGMAELGAVLEELGRSLVPGPFWSAATLGVPAVALSDNESLRAQWLAAAAGGDRRITLALQEDGSLPSPERVETLAEPAGGGRYRLRGRKRFVPDLAGADAVAVVARGPEGGVAFLVPTERAGATAHENRVTDATSRYGTLALEGVEVTDADRLGDWALVERLLRFGNAGIAALCAGGAAAVFEQAISHVKQRVQFGVPIGTFQAVQHPLAELFGEIEGARSAYLYAAWAVDHDAADAGRAVALARLTGTAAYRRGCTTSLQAHGGIAFTWEYDLHLHLKRALHLQWLLGGPLDYEEVIAREALGI
jgi:alkylation response protein AidB-like acyl-CoA dehydrogenase